MGTEGISNEKSLMFRHKSKILPNPLLGSYKVEKKNAEETTVKDDFLTSVSKGAKSERAKKHVLEMIDVRNN